MTDMKDEIVEMLKLELHHLRAGAREDDLMVSLMEHLIRRTKDRS